MQREPAKRREKRIKSLRAMERIRKHWLRTRGRYVITPQKLTAEN